MQGSEAEDRLAGAVSQFLARPFERILVAVRSLIEQGYFEIVLTGVHLGTYGQSANTSLAELVRAGDRGAALDVSSRSSAAETWQYSRTTSSDGII